MARVAVARPVVFSRTEAVWIGVGLVAILLVAPFAQWPGFMDIDWRWYVAGIDNLVAGRHLYDPQLLAGPYPFTGPGFIYAYNMPPWDIPLFAPFAAFGAYAGVMWVVAMDLATVAAIGLVLPQRHRWLILTMLFVSTPVLTLLVWGNLGSIVLLGIAVWLVGRRRSSSTLMLVGLLLASVKVLPAIPLALVMLREGRWRIVVVAAATEVTVVLALSVADGRNVLSDFVLATVNAGQAGGSNLAPSLYIGHQTLIRLVSVAAIAGLAAAPVSKWTISAMMLAVCGLVTNLYSDWLLIPVIVLLDGLNRDALDERRSDAAAGSDSV